MEGGRKRETKRDREGELGGNKERQSERETETDRQRE